MFYTYSFVYALAVLITIFLVICLTGYLIKTQTSTIRIRILDIILGYNKYLEDYYSSRKQEVERDLNIAELIKMKNSQELERRMLDEMKRSLDAQLQNSVYMRLPIDFKLPLNNGFVDCISDYVIAFSEFYYSLKSNTKNFLENYNKDTNKINFLLGYLSSICMDVNTKLFNTNSQSIRTHIRVKNNNVYTKLIAFIGCNSFNDDLTDIPIDNGMIEYAHSNRCSLIKSINIEHHYKGENDTHWKNYISFAISGIYIDNYPLLSMGISIANESLYNNLLYFINACQIERVISESIAQIDARCNIIEVITELHKGK